MDNKINIGNRIREARLNAGYNSQQSLADAISKHANKNITLQTISLWETGTSLPSMDNLLILCQVLDISLNSLVEEHGLLTPTAIKELYNIENMAKHVFTTANVLGNHDSIKALDFAKEAHKNQTRKNSNIPYIYHPLNMACHILALGIKDDAILAATLLHDVIEDCDYTIQDLPVSQEARELVKLVSHPDGFKHNKEMLDLYYSNIAKNPKAALIKLVDRCNNLTTMSWGLSKNRIYRQINETEQYVIPLLDKLKRTEYDNAKWLLSYQIRSMIDIYKRLI